MEEIGLDDFAVSIDKIDDNSLIEVFEQLVANQQEVKQKMRAYMTNCQQRLSQLENLVMIEIGEISEDCK